MNRKAMVAVAIAGLALTACTGTSEQEACEELSTVSEHELHRVIELSEETTSGDLKDLLEATAEEIRAAEAGVPDAFPGPAADQLQDYCEDNFDV